MIKNFDDFRWGLNLTQSTIIKDNEFTIAKNVFYNNAKQLQTRRWYRKFGNAIWTSPATSIFFFQRDDNLERILVANAGNSLYKYDNSSTFNSIYSTNIEYETRTWETTKRTRRDFCVYKNVIYMGDGVNPYASYDGTTFIRIVWKTIESIDTATEAITITSHWYTNGQQVTFTTWWTLPWWITIWVSYFVVSATTDTFKVSETSWWSAVNITSQGTYNMVSRSAWNLTFDHTTDTITNTAHWFSNNDEIYITTTWTIPTWLVQYQVYYVVNKTTNTFQLASDKNWTYINFTSNWTGNAIAVQLSEPRCRYIQYLGDRIYTAWDDANPSSLYYTNAAPADWTNINQNTVVIWWDEAGKINAINEYNQVIVAFKDQKSYAVNSATPSVDSIDSQTGWYSDRLIASVGNTLTYFNERWIDTLVKRDGVGDTSGIESKPISDNVREIFKDVTERQYNANCWWYVKKINNYYVTVDTDNDNIPETTLVYSSLVWSWTRYTFPPIYDYGYYINSSNQYQFLFSHGSWGQLYEYEYGFDDDWIDIDVEIQSKNFDFGDPAQIKDFSFMDFVWYKQKWWEIAISILVDGETVGLGTITDAHINEDDVSSAIWINPIWIDPLGSLSSDAESDLLLYKFTVKVQFFARGENIAFNMQSTGVQWILEKARVNVQWEPIEVFYYDNIL